MMLRSVGRALLLLLGIFVASSAFAQGMHVTTSTRQADGKVILAGEASAGTIKVGRLKPDGTLDPGFGTGGWTSLAVPSPDAVVTAVGADDTGRIWVAATLADAPALIRFASDGQPDSSFGTTAPGISWDSTATGLRINALGFTADNAIAGFGSAVGSEGYPRPSVARYDFAGVRNGTWGPGPHGTHRLASTSQGAFRSAVRWFNGNLVAAGYLQGSRKQMLIAGFYPDGTPDPNFGQHQQYRTLSSPMFDYEAFGIAVHANGWDMVLVGRDGWVEGGRPSSRMIGAVYNGSLWLTATMPVSLDNQTYLPADATAVSAFSTPDGLWIVAGKVWDPDTGRTHFVHARADLSYGGQGRWQSVSPIEASSDTAVGVYPAGAQFITVGTRNTPSGDDSLVVRYFADLGDLDTQNPSSAPDAMPSILHPPGWFMGPVMDADPEEGFWALFRVTGINVPVTISASQALYSVNEGICDANTSAPSTVTNGQYVCLYVVAASTPNTTVIGSVTIGDLVVSRSVTTGGPPDTTFSAVPPNPSGPSPTFSIAASPTEGLTGIECSLDGGPFGSCYYSNLAGGPHTVAARAVNAWGPDPTPVTYNWTVLALPETTITSGPPNYSNSSTATFEFVSDQPGATFECMAPGPGGWTVCTSPVTYTGLPEGGHWFYVRAINAAGVDPSPATRSWTTDYTAPSIILYASPGTPGLDGRPTSNTGGTFSFSAGGEWNVAAQCSIDGAPFAFCTNPYPVSGMGDGTHRFDVRAIDQSGNTSAPSYWIWTVDTTAPATTLGSMTIAGTSATFAFQSNEPGAFECRLDAAAFAACQSPMSFSGLAETSHSFQVRAVDLAGNRDATPASHTWVADGTPPETTITVHPPVIVSHSTARFEMASNESGVSFECRLDGGAWAACSQGGTQYPNLLAGQHVFEARTTDAAGNVDATPATFTWTIDFSYGPETAITSAPSGTVNTAAATITFHSPSGTPAVSFDCAFAGQRSLCTSPWTVTGLAEGEHHFSVFAIDADGNFDRTPASATWIVDLSAPETAIVSGPSGTVSSNSAAFVFSTENGATFQCSLDGAAFATCAANVTYSGLADGMHLLEVRARDAAGNADPTPASRTWSVDTTFPNTTIDSGPAVNTTSTSATFQFTSTEGGAFLCKLDGGPFGTCSSPQSYAALSEGSHLFLVYAVDAAGNGDTSPATWSWVIDSLAPETGIVSGPPAASASASATFTFTASEAGSTFECKLDAGAFAACTSPKSYTGLAQGVHTFSVRARDAMGNQDASEATFTWTVDTVAPETTISSGPSGGNNSNPVSFTFTSSESGTFECSMDNAAFAACVSGVSYSGLAKGQHTFQVRARDAAGNVDASAASRQFGIK